ncbi:IS3 family transposase [Bacillus thuringiensis]|uniref:IS3 family transposase n=1 Tax=Bacillus thuringiensis TaxID=1428 RepID=UPI003D6570BD
MRLESDKRLKKVIQSIHVKHKEYGYPRMKITLQEEGYFINHKKEMCVEPFSIQIRDSSTHLMPTTNDF